MDTSPPLSPPLAELSPELNRWLASLDLSRLPTLTKDAALKLLNQRGMPVKRSAVVTAFNKRERVSASYSGKRLASEYEVVKWAVSRLDTRDGSMVDE